MEKIKRSFAARLRNVLLFLLTLSMLILAILYIGGFQRADGAAALLATPLPEGAVPVGEELPVKEPLHAKDLLPLSFAAIRYGKQGGGAYGGEAAAKALLEYAAEPIHHSLSSAFLLTAVSKNDFGLALLGDYLLLDFYESIPYQAYYALTGEYTAAARSSVSVNADRLLLSFSVDGTATLYLSDGAHVYRAGQNFAYKATEVATLAADARLSPCTVTERGVAKCTASPRASSITLANDGRVTEAQYQVLLDLLGFHTGGAGDPTAESTVEPHGTLRMMPSRFVFSASRDGGITVSDLLDTAKDTLDIDLYDVLAASVALLEQLQTALPEAAGAELEPYLASFSHDADTFTVTFGASFGGIPLNGASFPFLAKMTVQSGRFRSVELRYVRAAQSGVSRTLFPSEWCYEHAAKAGTLRSLRLYYRLPSLPTEALDAAWYCTYESEVAE